MSHATNLLFKFRLQLIFFPLPCDTCPGKEAVAVRLFRVAARWCVYMCNV